MRSNKRRLADFNFLHCLYKKFERIPIIKEYLISVKHLILMIKPGTEKVVECESATVFLAAYGGAFLLYIAIGLFTHFSLYYGIMALVAVILWSRHILFCMTDRMERNMLKEFKSFLNLFYNKYTAIHGVEEAILEVLEEMDSDIVFHVEEIYDLLLQEDMDRVKEYKHCCPNSFVYSFLLYSFLAISYGDGEEKSESAFLRVLNILEQQIYVEILKREKLRSIFSGLIPICLLPMLFLYPIKKWGIYNLPQLMEYYERSYGSVVCYVLLFSTVLSYEIIMWLKNDMQLFFYQHPYIKKIAGSKIVKKYFTRWVQYFPAKVQTLNQNLRSISARITLAEFWVLRLTLSFMSFLLTVLICFAFSSVNEIEFVFLFVLALGTSILFYHLPVICLILRKNLMEEKMEQEVMSYYGLLSMFSDHAKTDVLIILEWMEMAAFIFQPSLTNCLDKFCNDSTEAMEHLMKEEIYMPFRKIVEALIASEEIGIKKALGNLSVEQQYLLYKQKQDNEIRAANRGALGRVTAFVPMVLTVSLYLILPFVLESLIQLNGYIKEMHIY